MGIRQGAGVQRVVEVDGQRLKGVAEELVGDEPLQVFGDLPSLPSPALMEISHALAAEKEC